MREMCDFIESDWSRRIPRFRTTVEGVIKESPTQSGSEWSKWVLREEDSHRNSALDGLRRRRLDFIQEDMLFMHSSIAIERVE